MKRILSSLLLVLVATTMMATDVTLTVAKDVTLRVSFLSNDIVRITKTMSGASVAPSLVVIKTPETVKVKQTDKDGIVTLKTDKMAVVVWKSTGTVRFLTKDMRELLCEGAWELQPIKEGADAGLFRAGTRFDLDADEAIYGIGLMENGKLNQRGENRRMIQSNLEDFQNIFQSLKGYAVFWDNYSPTQLRDTREDGLTFASEVADGIDYYFMLGGSADGNIALIRELTGDVPMLPMWSYGFWQSRERYKSQRELTEVLDRYRAIGVPLDGMILDWQYWDSNYLWNAMEFLNPEFGDAKGMIKHIHDQNAHLAISIWQSFGPNTKPYRDMDARDLLFNFQTWPQSGLSQWPPRKDYPSGVRVYKPYTAEARDIYWNHLKRLFDLGADVWWMDSTDPDHHDFKESDLDEPTALGTFRKVRNAFPLACVQGVYEHQRATTSDKRVMVLTRSGFAGQQRFASNVWTGDVNSNWPTLRNQIPMLLNFSLTGAPHCNTDIGGFFSGSYNHGGPMTGCHNPQFQELYVRWMQFGAFCPMMRSHGTETYREVYHFGKAGEPVYDALADAIRLRYRLIPYIYSTAWDVTHRRGTFMRALWMDFQKDARTHDLKDEFLFGRQLLVAPIVEAQYTQEKLIRTNEMTGWDKKKDDGETPSAAQDFTTPKTIKKYLPAGTQWYDFWTGKAYAGGQDITLTTTLASIPLFVRAGSILPVGDVMQSIPQRDWSTLELRVYPGADGTFTLYEDDGDTYAYEQGAYAEIPMTWKDKGRTLTLGARQGQFPGMLAQRTFRIVLPDGTKKDVTYNGKRQSIKL